MKKRMVLHQNGIFTNLNICPGIYFTEIVKINGEESLELITIHFFMMVMYKKVNCFSKIIDKDIYKVFLKAVHRGLPEWRIDPSEKRNIYFNMTGRSYNVNLFEAKNILNFIEKFSERTIDYEDILQQ